MAPHPDDLRARPAGSTIERELDGHVAAEPAAVFARLAALLDPHGESAFLADERERLLVVQGGYWYRAEYRIEAEGDGACVRFALLNVAPGWHALGALTGRRAIREAPRDFAALLARAAEPV